MCNVNILLTVWVQLCVIDRKHIGSLCVCVSILFSRYIAHLWITMPIAVYDRESYLADSMHSSAIAMQCDRARLERERDGH